MPSEAFEKFRRSMVIGYMEWHDGIGYDLEALRAVPADERDALEELIVARRGVDWRDLQALDCLGTERALHELRKSLRVKSVDLRVAAAEHLAARKLLSEDEIERILVEALGHARILDGMVRTLAFAARHATPAVRAKLLWCAHKGNDDIRAHAAALVHFLYGRSSSHFDLKFRPFYLRFGSRDRAEREAAYRELCAELGVEGPSGV